MITDQGLTIPRSPDILTNIQTSQEQNIANPLVFDDDTILGQQNRIIASLYASLYELIQALYDSMDRDKAEQEQLDRLLFLLGLRRQPAVATSGVQYLVGLEGTVVPVGSIVENLSNGNRFSLVNSATISSENCIECFFDVSPVRDSETYSININGNTFQIVSGISATADSIIDALVMEINNFVGKTWTASNVNSQLKVATDDENFIDVTAIAFLIPRVTTSPGIITALTTGTLRAPALAVNNIVTSVSGWQATFNPEELTVGRERETDPEFRLRSTQTAQIGGSSTIPAHLSAISNVPGVTSVNYFENVGSEVDMDGRPPGSYELVIVGGDDQDIAEALFGEKGTGIEQIGNTSETVTAINGQQFVMRWSRPDPVIVHVVCDYELYTEEATVPDRDLLIRQAMVNYGNTLQAGEDIIPDRFKGPIYNAVPGLGQLTIRLEIIPSVGSPPVGPITQVIPIAANQVASFNLTDAVANEI